MNTSDQPEHEMAEDDIIDDEPELDHTIVQVQEVTDKLIKQHSEEDLFQPDQDITDQKDIFAPESPVSSKECEPTVLRDTVDQSFGKTVETCLNHLPERILTEELARHGCSQNGSIDVRKKRLIDILSRPTQEGTSPQPLIEDTLVAIKTDINSLADEVAHLRREFEVSKNNENNEKTLSNSDKKHGLEMKKIKDLWSENLKAASQLKNSIEQNFRDLELAQVKVEEVDQHVRKFKNDLKNYYNSAFFREDSALIKDLHRAVVGTKTPTDWVNEERRAERKASTHEQTLVNPGPKSYSTVVATGSDPSPKTFSDRQENQPSQVAMSNRFEPLSSNSDSPPQPVSSNTKTSRRGPGYSFTSSVPKIPSKPPVLSNMQSSQQSAKFKTVLITDSILRHINSSDALGVNHEVVVINKRSTAGLLSKEVRLKIREVRPDYIYIHLGVNDASENIPLRSTLANFLDFKNFCDTLFDTKIILSLPIMTKFTALNQRIMDMRECIKELAFHFHEWNPPQPIKLKKLWINSNSNFQKTGADVSAYYAEDGVHLSERGKKAILGNFRHHIHHITRIMQDKPPKVRPTTSR